jgi:hypothetical protein
MEANQKWTAIITLLPRPWLLLGSLLVGQNAKEAMILLVGDQLLGPKGALLVDLLISPSLNHCLLGVTPSLSAPASLMCRFATHMVETGGSLIEASSLREKRIARVNQEIMPTV